MRPLLLTSGAQMKVPENNEDMTVIITGVITIPGWLRQVGVDDVTTRDASIRPQPMNQDALEIYNKPQNIKIYCSNFGYISYWWTISTRSFRGR